MSPQVPATVMRTATHPRIYAQPSRWEETQEFAAVLLAPRHCQVVAPGPRHWQIFCDLCGSARATGNLVEDAWFAALAMESGC